MDTINRTRKQQIMPDPTTKVRVSAEDELDVWVTGEGAPVVLIHGAMTRDLLEPLANELTSTGGYQVIHYGRRGHGGVGLPADPADIPGQASDVVALLDALGVDKAHVAGHSFGASIALELAIQAPDRLLSATLLELVFAGQLRTEAAQQKMKEFVEVAVPLLVDKYTSGDKDGAATMFWDGTSGVHDAAELIEPVLPEGAREMAAVDLNTFLEVELAAMGSWMADPATVKEITTPIAWIGGADSSPLFTESRALFQEWLPTTRTAEIAGTGHYFPTLKPAETATALDELLTSEGP